MNKNESKYYNTSLLMDEALLSILDEKDFEYISVKEICKKAGVSRSTFYLHYETMNDLLDETLDRITKNFYSFFQDNPTSIEEKINDGELDELVFVKPEYLKPYVTFVYENRKLFALTIKKPLNFNASNYFEKMYRSFFEPIMNRFNIDKNIQRYVVSYYCEGIIAIIKRWLKGSCKESVDEICNIIMWCLGKNVEKIQ